MANAIYIPIIKGDKGEKGDTPVNGVDYFTEVEKDVFKTDIKEALEDDVAGAKEMLDDLVDFYHDIKTIDTHEEVMDARGTYDTLKKRLDNSDNDLQNQINVEKARIDNITTLEDGSTTGDAELADIRVGADGTNYQNAGASIRRTI